SSSGWRSEWSCTSRTAPGTAACAAPCACESDSDEVDEPALDVDAHEPHPHAVADVDTALTFDDHPFHRRRDDAHERSLVRRAGDEPVERLASARGDEHRGR